MKILNKMISVIMAFAILLSNFSFVPYVFAEENNTNINDGDVVGGFKEVGSTTNEGDVYLSKEVTKTEEDGVYDVTLKTKGKNKIVTESQEVPIYAVVVFDKSGSMENEYCNVFNAIFNGCHWGDYIYKWDNAVRGAKEFASSLLNTYSKAQIALVTFDTHAKATGFANKNLDDVSFGSPSGNTSLGEALSKANELLDSVPESSNKYIVVISDGEPTDGNAYVAQANYAKESGYEIFAIGYEDEGTALKNMVSNPKEKHYSDGNALNISEVFTDILDNIEVVSPAAESATLSDQIGEKFSYVEGSAKLNGNSVDPTINGKTISYYIDEIGETEKVFTFKIRLNDVDEPGLYDTNGEAKVEYPDGEETITDTPQVNVKGYTYKVKYLEEGTDKVLASEETRNDKLKNHTYEEAAKTVVGYNPLENTKNITISEDNQELTFYYTKKNDLSYTVEYFKDTIDSFINSKEYGNQLFESIIIDDMIDKTMFKPFGYQDGVIKTTMPYTIVDGINKIQVLYNKRNDFKYTVKYVDKETKESVLTSEVRDNKTYLETYEESAKEAPFGYVLDDTQTKSITLTDDDMTLVFNYSKKNDFNYIVKYVDKETKEEIEERTTKNNITYNTEVTETAKYITGYNLVGDNTKTFIVDEYNKTITFEYSKKNDYNYIVKYVDKDTKEEIEERTTKSNIAYNTEVTETAKDITGYNLVGDSTKIFIVDEYDETITFEYTKKNDYNYIVKYLEEGTNKKLHDEKPVGNITYKTEVTENAEVISGYNVVGDNTKTFEVNSYNQEVIFRYIKKNDLVYTVKYYNDTLANLIGSDEFINQVFESQISESDINVNKYKQFGYQDGVITTTMPYTIIDGENVIEVLYNKRNDFKYTVKYVDKETKESVLTSEVRDNKTYLETYEESAKEAPFGYVLDDTQTKSITLTDEDMTLVFNYSKKNDFNYIVKYVDKDTKEEIEERTTKNNITYNTEVTETAKDIQGYNLVGDNTKTFIVDEYNKTITFEYSKKNDLSYIVKYHDKTNDEYLGYLRTDNVTFKTLINIDDIDVSFMKPVGYQDGVVDTTLPYMVIDGENIIDVFYSIKDDLTYRVEYYYDGVIDSSKTEVYENIVYGTIIDKYTDKLTDGYKFDKDTGSITVTDDKDNVIKVYYTKVEDEIEAPNTGVDNNNYLFMLFGILPLGLLSIKRRLNNVSIMK